MQTAKVALILCSCFFAYGVSPLVVDPDVSNSFHLLHYLLDYTELLVRLGV